MSSLALYRRYRPETFAEVIGQEHVTDPLQQALRNNRVNHAYLFSGPRGCGKTTSARILARCLNCEEGPTPTPCGKCQSCLDLARNGRGSIDVIEIDAASHGGVDDARDLREKAFFGPAGSRYKIYIIDEAHMVTSAGFNALLKVVEEPPEHLKFIFATTEPEKVIGTIRSRTHHYPFRLVPPGTLREYLAEVCGREDSPVEDGVLPLVVRAGAGSVRDSMSVMDQLLAGAGADGVTYAMATALLGYTDGSLLDSIVEAFAAGDGAAAFEVVDRVIEGGNDPRRFVADLLERLRDLVILAAVPDAGEKGLIDAPADVVERMTAQASVFGAAELSRAADLVNTGLTEMRGATSPRLQLELICARVLLPAAYDDERSVQARLDRLERGAGAALLGGAGGMSGGAGPGAAPGTGPAPVVASGGGPAAGYVPGPEAHPAMPAGPSGPAAARAAVRGAVGGGAGAPAAPAQAAPAPAAPEAPAPAAPTAGAEAPGAPVAGPGGEQQRGDGGGAEAPRSGPAEAPEAGAQGGGREAAAARPGAWPGSTGRGPAGGGNAGSNGPGAGRQPGGWPTAVAPGQGGQAPQSAPPAAPPEPAPGPPASAPVSPQPQPGAAPGAAQGAAQVRQMWPDILDAVKARRRFTWILLSQNAQVSGFDGTTLQIGFPNAGARDSFANGGSEDVLKDVLAERFQVQWRVEAIVDPSGGANPPAGGAPRSGGGGFGGGGGGFGGGAPAAPPQSGPQSPPPQGGPSAPPSSGSQYGQGGAGAGGGSGSAGGSQGARMAREAVSSSASAGGGQGGPAAEASYTPPEPPPTSIEYDMPAEDDPDLVDSALSGHDLIVRELGATVVEEFNNE
ncbi:DNA polymerase III subunit gamma and tau [Streptomyces decoyicus]|uniref:DNA polymerase III subunit gamma and tau n=1 Tax=Streptomyces decoyicus TaxID=249567 RepID=UPI00069FF761|nr:DNA polymerase III subunit gamma and tau [Streptomyces decoyicus]KOG37373.1 DNA polymerase III subunit gamma/tau [Streptomyces decoyicus]QZY17305.1 DNA polymerase III subunit gamma and tau [Streptomyces decoyicus]